jgi:hypothetical protein
VGKSKAKKKPPSSSKEELAKKPEESMKDYLKRLSAMTFA